MKTIKAFNKVWFYIIGAMILSASIVSCDTDDSDVSRLIAGGGNGPAPEKPFSMEGTWVAGGLNINANLSILSNDIPLGETVEGMLLDMLNNALPTQYDKLSDLEIALKIEPGTETGKLKLSSPTLSLLLGSNDLALELPQTDPFTIFSENGLATILKQLPDQKLTLLDYVTEETPKGILISESPLAGLAEMVGETYCPPTTTLKTVFFSFKSTTSSFDISIDEESRKGEAILTVNPYLTIEVDGANFLLGIMLKNKELKISVKLNIDEWTAL